MAVPETGMTGALDVLRLEGIGLLQGIGETLAEFGDDAGEDRQKLQDVTRDLRDSFFLVTVVGEFNAGKSTFVNALLGEDLLPTGITPTTATIDIVLYGNPPRRSPSVRDDGLREWAHPGTGAPGVALVDTPGTGSVFRAHERLALEFLHRSDLVLFVISARRALAQAGRDYLELAQRYGKKIVIIINQIDQLEPAEQAEVRRFVERQARELLNLEPMIFMVSARQDLDGGNAAQDGMNALRAHLMSLIRHAPPAQQKLLVQLDLAERLTQGWLGRTRQQMTTMQADRSRVDEVQLELEQQSRGLDAHLQETLGNSDQVFADLRLRGHRFLGQNLSLRNWGRARQQTSLREAFQEEVVGRSLQDLDQLGSAFVGVLLDQSRVYWRGVIERLQQQADLLEQEPGGLDASVYASQRESLQEALRLARSELEAGVGEGALDEMRSSGLTRINNLATSSLAALGGTLVALLGVAAPGPVLGAGAAALALPAVVVGAPLALIASALTLRRYRRLESQTLEEFDARIRQMRESFRDALQNVSDQERIRLTQYGQQVLVPVYSRMDVLTLRDQDRLDVLQGHMEAIARLRQVLQQG
ncbi:MAG: dynamin family protein [Anaerolineaceae bacterium]|nr:dynamin family protein [Anaerolineaceae bacterium]